MRKVTKQLAHNYSKRNGDVRYIVVHDTGNPSVGANAKAHFEYFNGGKRGSSADIFVDDREVWLVNDYIKNYTWHCGDGNGKYGITNANSAGVEICVNSDGDYDKALQNAAEIVRELMCELDIPLARVVRHFDASRKSCPSSMMKNDWAKWHEFKNMLEKEGLTVTQYEELKNEISELCETVKLLATEVHELKTPTVYDYIDDNMPEWARASVKRATDGGFLKGDENGRLCLADNMLRLIVLLDRTGAFGI